MNRDWLTLKSVQRLHWTQQGHQLKEDTGCSWCVNKYVRQTDKYNLTINLNQYL